jgi:hypothetical protein
MRSLKGYLLCAAVTVLGVTAAAAPADGATLARQAAAPKWHAAEIAPPAGSTSLFRLEPLAISCSGQGYCATGGFAETSAGVYSAVVATDSGGRWGPFAPLALPADATPNAVDPAQVTGMSCPARGGCIAVGDYKQTVGLSTQEQGFIAAQSAGKWHQAVTVPLPAADSGDGAELDSVSCYLQAYCVAAGTISQPHGPTPFIVVLSHGSWVPALPPSAPGLTGYFSMAVSCRGTGDCTMTATILTPNGSYSVGWIESAGHWGKAATLAAPPGATSGASLSSVGCTAPGSCVAAGSFLPGVSPMQVVLSGGHWHRATAVGGNGKPRPRFGSVTCTWWWCVAVGTKADAANYALSERHGGTLGGAVSVPVPANAAPLTDNDRISQLTAVSCVGTTWCATVGYYTNKAGVYVGMVATS